MYAHIHREDDRAQSVYTQGSLVTSRCACGAIHIALVVDGKPKLETGWLSTEAGMEQFYKEVYEAARRKGYCI